MGKRTVFQVDAKAQMVVLATRSRVASDSLGDAGLSRAQMGLDSESKGAGDREEDVYAAPVLVSEDGQVG